MVSFECNSVIRGYQAIWVASYGETFNCIREIGNLFDPFAVVRGDKIISHVPRLLSVACSLFLRHSGSISAKLQAADNTQEIFLKES